MIETLPKSAARLPDTFGQVVTEGRWRPYRWLVQSLRAVAWSIRDGGNDIIVTAPPRHGKTMGFGNILPAWFLYHWPHKRIIYASSTAERAREEGRRTKQLIEGCAFGGVKLSEDSKAAGRWSTDQNGGMYCVGVGGSLMGWGGHVIILDDLYGSWEDAMSPVVRARVIDWFTGTVWNRREPGARIVHATTRFHRNDLVGWMLKEHGNPWDLHRYPALAEKGDPLGRAEGEALVPERYDAEAMEDARRGSGSPEKWCAIFQQAPEESSEHNVYRNFTAENVDAGKCEITPKLPLDVAIDFNINPGMHLEVGQHDPARDISWVRHEIFGPRLSLDGAMDRLATIVRGMNGTCPKKIRVFGDASGNSREIGDGKPLYDKVRSRLERIGVPYSLHVPTSNPPVLERVSRVNDALLDIDGVRRLFVHPDCTRLVYDLGEMQADTDGLPDKSDQSTSHASDAAGYWLHEIHKARAFGAIRSGRMVSAR